MTSLFTTVSGFLGRSLVMGAFLPTVIFVTFFLLFVFPLIPSDFWLVGQLKLLGTEWQVLSATFITIVASCLLYTFNVPITRFYSGYPWEHTWLGGWRANHHRKIFRRLDARQRGMRTLQRKMLDQTNKLDEKREELKLLKKETVTPQPEAVNKLNKQIEELTETKQEIIDGVESFLKQPLPYFQKKRIKKELWKLLPNDVDEKWQNWFGKISYRRGAIIRNLLLNFPGREEFILPTALGNTIRSFEYYSNREYGIDAVVLYQRLMAKVDKDFAGIIENEKSNFDFMLNSSFLSFALAVLLICTGLLSNLPAQNIGAQFIWIGKIIFFLFLSYAAYVGAVNRAGAWGEIVKSAFDLYRNALLQQLGYSQLPKTRKDEKNLWTRISAQILYGNLPEGSHIDYNALTDLPVLPTTVLGEPTHLKLTVLRTVDRVESENIYQINILIKNEDESKSDAKKVILTDTLPADMLLRRDSTKVLNKAGSAVEEAKITGTNPYRFEIGSLKHNEEKTVTYEVVYLTKEPLIVTQLPADNHHSPGK